MVSLIVFVGGALLGVLIQRIVDELIKPDISIEVGHEAFVPSSGTPQHKFLHVSVSNKKKKLSFKIDFE